MEKIPNLKTLMHDPDYYTKAFHAYAKKSAKFQVLADWADKIFPTLVGEKLTACIPADTTLKMLGIGSGSGEMDSKLACDLKTRFKAVQNVVLDPAAGQLVMYRDLIKQKGDHFAGIDFDLRQETIDGYRKKQEEAGSHPKYHFISAVHSLYYADDHADTIGYLYNCLEEGGILLVIVVSDVSGFWRLWNHFTKFQDSTSRYLCTRHIHEGFSANSIRWESAHQESFVDITSCFDPVSEEGKLIVDFLSHTVDLRGTAPPAVHQSVLDFMGSEECAEKGDDGSILFNNDWDCVFAQKKSEQV